MAPTTWELSTVGFDLLWTRCGFEEFPLVLQLVSHGRTFPERDQLLLAERPALQRVDAMRGATVHPDLVTALGICARPDSEVDLRGRAGRRRWRVLGAADAHRGVVLVREADRVRVSLLDPRELTARVVATLPEARSGRAAQLNAPTAALTEVMSRGGGARDVAAGLQALRCTARDAPVLAEALTTVTGSADLGVAWRVRGRRVRHPEVVTVLDTSLGRYVCRIEERSGAQRYTTVLPATPGSVVRAVHGLHPERAPADGSFLRSV